MPAMNESALERLKRFDEERPTIPGEHWLTLGAGLWLLMRESESVAGRLASIAAGAALVWRAATGSDGFVNRLKGVTLGRRLTDRTGTRRSNDRYIDLAAPWPYTKRV